MLNRRRFLQFTGALTGSLLGSYQSVYGQGQRYAIPPNVQHITENTAQIYFRTTDRTQNGHLLIYQEDAVVQDIPFEIIDSFRKQITVENLTPATNYQYQIVIDDAELAYLDDTDSWQMGRFRTPPFEFPFKVAAVGDSGFGDATSYQLAEQMALLEPDMFFHLGDVVYHMNDYNNDHFMNWKKKYFDMYKPLLTQMPHYPTFGNHDLDPPTILDGLPTYYWMFPLINEDEYLGSRMWYSFDINNIQLISLNSQLFYSYPELRNTQEAWLDEKLARTDVRYTVVFFHIPPNTSSSPHQWDGIYVADQWAPKFTEAKVPLVINGHAHVYERLKYFGVNYITAGAGSNVIYGEGERLDATIQMWRLASFPLFEFYEDRIHMTTRDMNGQIIDEADFAVEK